MQFYLKTKYFIQLTGILKLEQKKNKERLDRRKRKAHVISRSVQHLLQHTAGWDAAKENDIIGTRKLKLSRKITNLAKCSNAKELVMRQMMFRPTDFQPGTTFSPFKQDGTIVVFKTDLNYNTMFMLPI